MMFLSFFSSFLQNPKTAYLYPAGNSRVEPIGVIIFASAMFVASFQIIIQVGFFSLFVLFF